jgi:ABC-type dipeptide/oligopeptide/nickel transport system permease component
VKKYVLRRLLSFIPVLLGVVTIAFLLMRLLPGDPAAIMLSKSGASAEQIRELRVSLGLDQPIYVQYWAFLSGIARGDFGTSIWEHRPVMTLIGEQLPSTLQLALAALLLSLAVGITLGILAAIYRDSWIDRLSVMVAVLGVSMPMFWSGLLLILLFGATLNWLPVIGQGGLKHLILPAATLGFACVGTITRTVRSSMVEVLQQEYVTTARSKGLTPLAVVWKHALPNALIPAVTLVGLQFGWLLGGTVVIETVFSRQGLGQLLVQAILWKDLPLVQGAVLVTAVMYLVVNLIVDLTYGLLDPRIRLD